MKFWKYFAIQMFCILGITYVSGYKVPDLKEANWDIALFLTPIGMLENFMAESPLMRSFYSDIIPSRLHFSSGQFLIIALLFLLELICFYKLSKAMFK